MGYLHVVAFLLLIVGGLNWLSFALFGWEVGSLFGGMSAAASKVIYVLVGLAAVFEIAMHGKNCKTCSGMKAAKGAAPAGQI